ncbi:hypothetical protein GCM10025781_27320 [Kocuria gwangalliensis]|uniref:Uncharacterized protein n=1 Tax=Kocuria gwangalliensis TaxID=501592 RepID=A0ABP8XI82_9MICC
MTLGTPSNDMRFALETALYFPHIRVPKAAWFTQVLLYWEDVASIIPRPSGTTDITN